MKFGVSLWLWTSPVTNKTIEHFVPVIAEMGFDTIEVPIEDPDTLDASAAGKVIKENGLSVTNCAAMGPGRDLVHPDKDIRAAGMEYIKKSIEASHEMGSDTFAGPLYAEVGRLWNMTAEERTSHEELLVSQLQQLSEHAKPANITLCVEALNRFETSFLNLTSQVNDIVDRVNHPNCKILFDLFHAGIEEKNLGDAIREAGDRLFHFQLAENDRGTPGTGQLDWNGVAEALKDIHYDRHVVIETFTPDNKILAKAASIWRPLADSPDALAKDGLKFLKDLLS
ncbi:MAG: sugar phosphate isomerase/epimerase [Balneolaceae bacterium]|nr:sugar phosphate isomerase/epimerase [Balneolaceae bacterium]